MPLPLKAVIFDFNRTVFDPDADALMPGAAELIAMLRKNGVTLFLIAKGDDERRKNIERLGLVPFFAKIIVNQSKSAEDYQSCVNLCPGSTQFFAIGDRVREEIRHANSCGMTTIWFRNGKFSSEEPESDEELPHFTIASLAEAAALIL